MQIVYKDVLSCVCFIICHWETGKNKRNTYDLYMFKSCMTAVMFIMLWRLYGHPVLPFGQHNAFDPLAPWVSQWHIWMPFVGHQLRSTQLIETVTEEMLRCVGAEISYQLNASCGNLRTETLLINVQFGVLFFIFVMVKKIYSEAPEWLLGILYNKCCVK